MNRQKTPNTKRLAALVILALASFILPQTLTAQNSFNMVNNDTILISACQTPTGTVYDDGGVNLDYSNNFEGWAIISAPAGATITLSGNYNTENNCDFLWVYDGYGSSGSLLANVAGNGTINVSSSTGWLSIRFHSDGSIVRSGFALAFSTSGTSFSCSNPVTNLSASAITTTSATLTWSASNAASNFTVVVNGTAQQVTTNTLTLTDLNPNTRYDVSVSDNNDISDPCCIATTTFRTLCGVMSVPFIELFDDYGTGLNVLPSCWVRQTNYDDADGRYPQLVSSTSYSSPASLMMFCGTNNENAHWSLAIGPEISGDIASQFARLHIRATSANAKIEIGICDDTSLYDNNFTPIDTITITVTDSWQENVVSLSRYNGSGNRIAFRMIRSLQPGNSVTVYIDNLIIESCGVRQILRTWRDINDVYVQWVNIGTPTVDIEIGPVGFLQGTGTTYTDVTSPFHITGLDPATTYQLRFYTSCYGTAREQTGITFSTLDSIAYPLDLCESFESNGDNIPAGWLRRDVYINSPRAYTYASYSGSRGLVFHPQPYGGLRPLVAMPRTNEIDVNQLSLSFMLRSDYYSSGYIEIGVTQYPEYSDSFVPLDTVQATPSWTSHTVSLSGYTGNGRYITLRAFDHSSNSNSIYLDNLQVSPCIVTGQQATNIAAHHVELRWDTVAAHFHADSVVIQYGPAGFADGEGTTLHVPTSGSGVQTIGGKQRYVVSGLSAGTDYEFLVYGNCAEVSQHCAFARLSASTLEADIQLPYCQQFDGLAAGGVPAGWLRPTMYNDCPRISTSQHHSGSNSLEMYAYGGVDRDHSVAVMPLFDTDSLNGLTVSFWSYGNSYYCNSYIQVGVMDSPSDESTFHVIATVTMNYHTWTKHAVSLADYHGEGRYIAFRYILNNSYNYTGYIDDIVVSDAAATNVAVYNVSSHGASFSWNGEGRSYSGAAIEWGPDGFTPGSGTSDTVDASTFSYTVDTLQTGATYNLFVTPLSSESSDICNYYRYSFSTAAQPLVSSYCYGFEDATGSNLPALWTAPVTYDYRPRLTTSRRHSGSYSLEMYARKCSQQYDNMVVMPMLEDTSLDGLTLHFWYNEGESTSRLVVGMVPTSYSTTVSDTLAVIIVNNQSGWSEASVDLSQYSGPNRHIAFFLTEHTDGCNFRSLFIDDITINRCNVTDVNTYSHTTSSFNLRWNTNGTADSVEVEYGPWGFTPGNGTVIADATSPTTISGLQAGTIYDYYLRPHCTGSGNVCAESKYSTATLSSHIAAGFCEDFEIYSNNERPLGWTTLQSSSSWPFVWTHPAPEWYATSGNRSFEFRANSLSPNLIVMPASEESLDSLILSFNIRCSNAGNPSAPSLVVGAVTLPYDASTFVAIDTIHPSYHFRNVSVSLAGYTGSGRHIAFQYLDDNNRITYIDDIALSHCQPVDIQTSALTDNSVTLSWQRLGYSGNTIIIFDTIGADAATMRHLRTAATSITIDSLVAGRSYQFFLYGECQDTTLPCHASTVAVTTLDAPFTIPVCEDFENYSANSTPHGWLFPIDLPYLATNGDYAYPGGYMALRMPARGGTNPLTSFAAMPFLQTDGTSTVYLDARATANAPGTTLTVGILADPSDTSSFTPVQSFSPSTSGTWSHIQCSFAAYSNTSGLIAFRTSSSSDDQQFVFIDNINLRHCAVTNARAATPTETSITLHWATTATSQAAYVEYKATGSNASEFAPGSGTLTYVTDNPHTFTDLEEATWYTFHVYPVCDSVFDGCNYETTSLQTLHPWVDIPYCENFESINDALPNNWVDLSSTGNSPSRGNTSLGHDSTASHFVTLRAAASDTALFVLPRIYIGSQCPVLNTLYANFWTLFGGNVSQGLLEVGVVTDANDPSTFTPHDTVSPNDEDWQHNIMEINDYHTADSYVAFRLTSLDGSSVYCNFDDLCMEKCVAADVTVYDITQNSVTISWNNYSVDTLICEYGPRGHDLGTGTVIAITTSPYTVTGLADGSAYDFTFSSQCGCGQYGVAYTPGGGSWGGSGGWGGWGWGWRCCVPCVNDSTQQCRYWSWGQWHGHSWSWWYSQSGSGSWVVPPVIDVSTQAAMLTIPYCESFEISDTLAFPPSWRRKADSHYPDVTTSNNHTGRKSMRFYATSGTSCLTALPPLETGTTASMVMTFYAYSTNSDATTTGNARFYIGVMTDPDNQSSFVAVDSVQLTQISRWQQFTVDFADYSGPGQYIAFKFSPASNAFNYYIDDIYIAPCAISDITAVTSGSNATVGWTTHNSPSHILIQYGPQGENPEEADSLFRSVTAFSSPATIVIDPDSNYDFYVSAVCDDPASAPCLISPLTINPAITIPFCETFDGYPNGVLPDNWKAVQRNSSRPQYPITETQHGDHQILALYPSSGINTNTCLLQPLPHGDGLNGKWLNVSMSSKIFYYTSLDFGYLADTNDPSSFVQMAVVNNTQNETLQEFNVAMVLPDGVGDGNRLAIRARCNNGSRWIRLDRLIVSNNPYPLGISHTDLGVATKEIRWTGGLAHYTLEYGYDNHWQQATSDSCHATISDLLPDRDYEVYFIAPDGERLCLPYTFHNEDFTPLPHCEYFDGYTGSATVPDGWTRVQTTSYTQPYINSEHTLEFRTAPNGICQASMPDIAIDSLKNADLSFSIWTNYYMQAALIVGVSSTRNGHSTFVPVDTVRNTRDYTWQDIHINLQKYQGSGRYITFRMLATSSNYTLKIDNLTVSPCPLPNRLTQCGATSIQLSASDANAVDYYIEYAPQPFTQGQQDTSWNDSHTDFSLTPVSSIVHVTDNPFTLTGLSPSTTYTIYTRCDTLAATCASPLTVTTPAMKALPYCESFDAYDQAVPDWYSYSSYSSNPSYPCASNICYTSCCRSLRFYCTANDLQYIVLPDLDIDSIRHIDMQLNLYTDYYNEMKLIVGVMDNRYDFSTFTPVDTLTTPQSGSFFPQHVSFNNYTGTGRFVALRMASTRYYSSSIYVDDIHIQACPRVTASLATGATVRFDVDTSHYAPDYWIEYGPQGFSQLDADTVWNSDSSAFTLTPANNIVHVTSTPFFISGLDDNTTYDFFSRCDSATATCFSPNRITTSETLPMPYCNSFDQYTCSGSECFPAGWRRYHSNNYYNTGNRYPRVVNWSNNNKVIEFYNDRYNICYAAMPDLDVENINETSLTLWLYNNDCNNVALVVGVMSDLNDFSTFVPVDTLRNTASYVGQVFSTSFRNYSGNGRFIAFSLINTIGNYRYLHIDDIRLQACPLASATLTAGTTVSFDIDTSHYAPDYWIEYGPQGFSQLDADTAWNSDSSAFSLVPANTIVHVTHNPFSIDGLSPGTTYDFYTRCDSATAACTPAQQITTSAVVDIPFCQNFANFADNTLPAHWRRFNNDDSNYPSVYDSYLRFYKYNSSNICQAVLSDFGIDSIKDINITFSVYAGYVNDGIIVGVMTDPDRPESFTPVDTMLVAYVNTWTQFKPRMHRYVGNGRFIALRDLTTGNYHAIRVNDFYIEDCDIPVNATASLHSSNTVRIDADEQSSTGFYVEYGPADFAQGEGSFVHVTHTPYDLELDYNVTSDFYFRCDSVTPTCRTKQTVTTAAAPTPLPLCEGFETYNNNTLPTGWQTIKQSGYGYVYTSTNYQHSGTKSLYFTPYYRNELFAVLPDLNIDSLKNVAVSLWLKGSIGERLSIGALSNPADPSSFLSVRNLECSDNSYKRYLVNFSSLPSDARFIAIRYNGKNCCWHDYYLDDIYIDTVGACDFRVANIESDEVTFVWSQVGHPAMTIEYGPTGFARGSGTTIAVTQSPYTLTGIDPLTNYSFYFDAVSQPNATGFCNTNYSDSASLFTPAGGTGCIDPTNLTADYTTCLYGSYGNPYGNVGIVDYGSDDIRSRHTVHYDTSATDPRTGNLLRIVPQGSNASVRLGNWSSNDASAEAEAVTYSLLVDTTSFDLLVLKYAAVLQDPLHGASVQPRFKLEVLDENNELLDSQCAAADFIANRNLGWNQAEGGVLWKDWTTVGVDMSPYAGQTVRIRLTTYDCGEGSHYGYAYFTLGCMMKNMRSELCGDVDSNTFYAPAGFSYQWYSSADTSTVISNSQSIKVATDTITYYCRCSFVDNSNCHFTISAYAGTRYPLASFDYSTVVRDCKFHVSFNNTSTISPDGITPLGTGEPCENAIWNFGDGEASSNYNATHVYDAPGTYTVRLVAGIADNTCLDTAELQVAITLPGTSYGIDGDEDICIGQSVTLDVDGALSFVWNDGDTLATRTFSPDTTTQYFISLTDSNGCVDTVRHTVVVHPITYTDVAESVVENDLPFSFAGNDYPGDTLDTITLASVVGCDSIIHFSLTVFRNVVVTVDSSVCQSALPLAWNSSIFTGDSSTYDTLRGAFVMVDSLTTHSGADSVITMLLRVTPTTYSAVDDTIVENQLPYTFNGNTYVDTDFSATTLSMSLDDVVTIANAAGCDSVISYSLFVYRNVADTVDSTVCQSVLPLTWNSRTFTGDSSCYDAQLGRFSMNDTTLALNGADSVITMLLNVTPTTYAVVADTVVENDLPVTFNGNTYTCDTADTLTIANIALCDSIISYSLHVYSNIAVTVDSSICQSALPLVWDGNVFTGDSATYDIPRGAFVMVDSLTTHFGADSVITMLLRVTPTSYSAVDDTIVENQLPYTFNGNTYVDTDFSTTTLSMSLDDVVTIANAAGCDSVISYSLFVYRNVADTVDSTVCQSVLPLAWNSRTFTGDSSCYDAQLGRFSLNDTILALNGADSVITMLLNVIPTTYAVVADTVVENDLPVTFNGNTYTCDTVDTLTIANIALCDSIISYSLHVHSNIAVAVDSSVCPSALPITWNDSLFIAPGVKSTTLTASTGADSTVTMTLALFPVYDIKDTSVVCRNTMPFAWRDTLFADTSASGDYTIHRLSANACDSVMSIHLVVGETSAEYDTLSVCSSPSPLSWRDTAVNASHTVASHNGNAYAVSDFALRRTTLLGCDSMLYLNLTVFAVYDFHDTAAICENSLPYTWRDTTLNPSTVNGIRSDHSISRTTVNGCDSVMHINLTVDTNSHASIHNTTIENALPYSFNNILFDNDVQDSVIVIANTKGCDSVISFSLTVFRNTSSAVERTVCDDVLPLQWNHCSFSGAGTQSDTLTAHTGADSVVVMTLFVNATYHTDEEAVICSNTLPLTWHDTIFGTDETGGTYSRLFASSAGCDSSFSLLLTVNDDYHTIDSVENCEPFTWIDGVTYSASIDGPQVTLPSAAGCDSTVTLHFVISEPVYTQLLDSFCTGSSFIFHGRELTIGGTYVDTLSTYRHCDSIVTLVLTELSRPDINISADPSCLSLTFTVNASASVDHISWTCEGSSWNDNWGPQDGLSLRVRPSHQMTFTLTADYLDVPTCPASKSIVLNPIVQPLAQVQYSPDYINYDNPTLTALDRSSGASERRWYLNDADFGDNVSISYTPDPFDDSLTLMLIVNSEHCSDTAAHVIPIYRNSIFAPNVFTPDESSNREFLPLMEGVVDYELSIYTRQGILVFNTKDPEEAWNGTYKGKPCPQASYVWIVNYTTNEAPRVPKVQKGTVLLLR